MATRHISAALDAVMASVGPGLGEAIAIERDRREFARSPAGRSLAFERGEADVERTLTKQLRALAVWQARSRPHRADARHRRSATSTT